MAPGFGHIDIPIQSSWSRKDVIQDCTGRQSGKMRMDNRGVSWRLCRMCFRSYAARTPTVAPSLEDALGLPYWKPWLDGLPVIASVKRGERKIIEGDQQGILLRAPNEPRRTR